MIYALTTTTVPKKRNKWKKFKGGHKIQTFKANIFKPNFFLDEQFEQGKITSNIEHRETT
jgi:hypothetical protein